MTAGETATDWWRKRRLNFGKTSRRALSARSCAAFDSAGRWPDKLPSSKRRGWVWVLESGEFPPPGRDQGDALRARRKACGSGAG